ncbi:MAG: hypothetical protein Q4C30_05250 [Bacteroidia bacterium]|nr:hypothetical protein [Bacteroidia bacterium]
MNRITIFTLAICLLASFSPDANAQRFLKGLADKAKDKVLDKLEQKTDKSVDKKQSNTDNNKGNVGSTESTYSYVPPMGEPYWSLGKYFTLEDNADSDDFYAKSSLSFKSQLDLLSSLPAVPSVKQILDADAQVSDNLNNYLNGVTNFVQSTNASMMQAAQNYSAPSFSFGAQRPTSVPNMPNTNALAQKMMEAIMNSGLNPETATEADMQRVVVSVMSKEYGVPEAEMSKIIKMAQTNPDKATAYLTQKYPAAAKKMNALNSEVAQLPAEEEPDKYAALLEESLALRENEAFNAAIQRAHSLPNELKAYADELLSGWTSSEEYAKIQEMDKKLNEDITDYLKNSNSHNDVLPDKFSEPRRAENEIIRTYNEKLVAKWCDKVKEYIEYFTPYAKQSADMADRLAEASKNSTNQAVKMMASQTQMVFATYNNVSFDILYKLPAIAMDAPRIDNLSEDISLQ